VKGRSEAGFTLIELAVAVSVLGLVMGAMVGVFVTLLKLSPTTGSTYSESHDAQLAASYWVTDVQGAESVTVGTRSCPTSRIGTTPLVSFQWATAGGVDLAVYQCRPVAVAGSTPQDDLVRTFFVIPNGAPGLAPTSTVIAHHVQPVRVVYETPTVATSRLTVTEASGYTFTVAGTRRVATPTVATARAAP
jgi:prepilin-type N-terminal cleavage/methylation domain-containing protein